MALLSFTALDTFLTNKFGKTFVYKLPGPIIIASASSMASITPGAGLQLDGEIYILFIASIFSETISGILSFLCIVVPSVNSAQIVISSKVTGKTLPTIFKTFLLFSTDSEKFPYFSFFQRLSQYF